MKKAMPTREATATGSNGKEGGQQATGSNGKDGGQQATGRHGKPHLETVL